ncbi:MAG TPA: hypothetical protein VD902_13950, partial [Symbiobacteriaceae bacterium]|nr:hypothetical protein [Symbiobacteriaceae bacterium]
ILWRWIQRKISARECIVQVAKTTGLKVAKVALLLVLLSNPVTGTPTTIFLLGKMALAIAREYLTA